MVTQKSQERYDDEDEYSLFDDAEPWEEDNMEDIGRQEEDDEIEMEEAAFMRGYLDA